MLKYRYFVLIESFYMDLTTQFCGIDDLLTKLFPTDTMCFGYQLALLYSADKFKAICVFF